MCNPHSGIDNTKVMNEEGRIIGVVLKGSFPESLIRPYPREESAHTFSLWLNSEDLNLPQQRV